MFKGLNRQKFYKKFKSEEDCKQYLFAIKWKNGFICRRCSNPTSGKGKDAFHLRCTKCRYDESVTANTAFHKLKIPLLKAFGLAFEMAVSKKGKSSNSLGKEFEVNQKTAFAFRKRAHRVFRLNVNVERNVTVDSNLVIDGITITKREDSQNGFQRISLHINKFPSQNAPHLEGMRAECILPFLGEIDHSRLIGGKFKEEKGRMLLWNFKVWLTGTHHHCSLARLEGYLDEFLFRYIHRNRVENIWHEIIELFMTSNPNKTIILAT